MCDPTVLISACKIPGWYTKSGLAKLWELATEAARLSPRRALLEIGTWRGRSAYVLGQVAARHDMTLFCVDTWGGYPEGPQPPQYQTEGGLGNVLEDARRALEGLPVEFIQMNSRDVLSVLPLGGFALVHVDGDHRSPQVDLDVFHGWWLTASGGILCGDDYEEVCPTVDALARAVKQYPHVYEQRVWWFVK